MARERTGFLQKQLAGGRAAVARIYARARRDIEAIIQRGDPLDLAWQSVQRAKLAEINRVMRRASARAIPMAAEAARRGYGLGRRVIRQRISRAGAEVRSSARFSGIHETQARILAANLTGRLRVLPVLVGRQTRDLFRSATLRTLTLRALGVSEDAQGRRESVRRSLARTLERAGVRSFVDRAGKSWNLDVYAEMATRTTLREASSMGTALETYENGFDLVEVIGISAFPDSPCVPFQGKQLSVSGRTPGVTSLEQARAEGFQHPNCLVGETLIQTSEGIVPIRGVCVGSSVKDVMGIPQQVRSVMKRQHIGFLMTVRYGGSEVTGTPEHAALTETGWRPLEYIGIGDRLPDHREAVGGLGVDGVVVDPKYSEPASLQKLISGTILRRGRAITMRSSVDLDDQGMRAMKCEVGHVSANRMLEPEAETLLLRPFKDQRLACIGIRPESVREFLGAYFSNIGAMGVSSILDEVIDRAARRDAVLPQKDQSRAGGLVPEVSSNLPHRLLFFDVDPSQRGLDLASILVRASTSRMIHCESITAGEGDENVYDLETSGSFVLSNGAGVHNCIHDVVPVFSAKSRLPPGAVTARGMRSVAARLARRR